MKRNYILALLIFVAIGLNAQMSFESYASKSIYSFIRYVNWPTEVTNQDFKIAVIGDFKVYEEVNKLLSSRSNGNYKFKIIFYKKAAEYTGFHHLVFVDALQNNKLEGLMATINNNNTLVITESEGATEKGSMINFVVQNGGSVKFELSPSNIESNGLKVDSRLEALAIVK